MSVAITISDRSLCVTCRSYTYLKEKPQYLDSMNIIKLDGKEIIAMDLTRETSVWLSELFLTALLKMEVSTNFSKLM